jgi:hypothetical protein
VGRHRINNIATIFDKIWNFINDQPTATLTGLQTTGGKGFSCQAKITRDQRKYISLPHSNRVYESDWAITSMIWAKRVKGSGSIVFR